jgi:FixJ family two-component response regulator
VEQLLLRAHAVGKQFHVVVCDARPDLEGAGLLQRLTQQGVRCTYVLVTALAFVMPHVTKASDASGARGSSFGLGVLRSLFCRSHRLVLF